MRRPVFVRHMSVDERRLLEDMRLTAQSLERVRIQIIIESSEGSTAAEIAQHVGWTPRAVRRVLQRFNACGLSSVYDRRHMNPGRHRIVTEEWQGYLMALIEQSPTVCGYPTERWTAKLLSSELARRHGIFISEERVRHYLRRNGYRFGHSGWCRDVDYRAPAAADEDALALIGDGDNSLQTEALAGADEIPLDS